MMICCFLLMRLIVILDNLFCQNNIPYLSFKYKILMINSPKVVSVPVAWLTTNKPLPKFVLKRYTCPPSKPITLLLETGFSTTALL